MHAHPYDPKDGDLVKQLIEWEGEYHYPSGLLIAAALEIRLLRARLARLIPPKED